MAPPPPASAVESPISVTPVAVSLPSPAPDDVSDSEPPKSRQVSKFQDLYAMVRPYCGIFEFEWNPNYDHTKDCDTEDEEDEYHIVDPIPTAIKYVNQIRESFGFDVDCVAPSWLGSGFIPVDMSKAKLNNTKLYDRVVKSVEFTITEINADMSGSGKSIELVELVKVVRAAPAMLLLTLKVKEVDASPDADDEGEDADDTKKIIQAIVFKGHGSYPPLMLEQWRFKPLDGDDFWYKAPPVDAAKYAAVYGHAAA